MYSGVHSYTLPEVFHVATKSMHTKSRLELWVMFPRAVCLSTDGVAQTDLWWSNYKKKGQIRNQIDNWKHIHFHFFLKDVSQPCSCYEIFHWSNKSQGRYGLLGAPPWVLVKRQQFALSPSIPTSSPKFENVVPGPWICGFLRCCSQVYFLLLSEEQEIVRSNGDCFRKWCRSISLNVSWKTAILLEKRQSWSFRQCWRKEHAQSRSQSQSSIFISPNLSRFLCFILVAPVLYMCAAGCLKCNNSATYDIQ